MSQLTQEQFERILTRKLAPLATKQDVREAVEELARTVNSGFDHVDRRFDEVVAILYVRERNALGRAKAPEDRRRPPHQALTPKTRRQGQRPAFSHVRTAGRRRLPPTPEPVPGSVER